MLLQGKDAVPESVDHVLVRVDPKEDRTWLQSEPAVATDNAHALDKTGAPLLACFQKCGGLRFHNLSSKIMPPRCMGQAAVHAGVH